MSSFTSIPMEVRGTESDHGSKIKNHDEDEYGNDTNHPRDKNNNNCVTKDQDHDATTTATATSNDKPIFRKRSLSLPSTCGRIDTFPDRRCSEGELLLQEQQRQQQQQPSNDHYMSEPSLSEDGTGASSSNYTPLTPINRAIHMTHSHSNTSLSSLGSPSYANAKSSSRKKIYFFGDHYKTSLGDSSNNSNNSNTNSNSNSIAATAAAAKKKKKIQNKTNASLLLSPIEAYSEGDSTHVGEESEMNVPMPMSIPDNCKLSTDDFQKEGEGEKYNVQHSLMTSEEHNRMECSITHENCVREQTNDNEQVVFLDNDTKIPFFQLLGDGATPDSQRYMAAMEGSHGSDDGDVVDDDDDGNGVDDDDDDGSSDLSYDSSSSQENDGKGNGNDNGKGGDQSTFHKDASLPLSSNIQTGHESCHYLNKPSTVETPKSSGNARSKKKEDEKMLLEDEEMLLKNTDSGSMDLSLIMETKSPYSPDDSLLAETPSSNFMITTPPRITPFDFPEAAEESITPKMKTSRPSSISGSPSSHSDGGRKSILTMSASHPTSLEPCEKDEKMGRQNRVNSGERRHRRTRSGDEAAAMISTGSSEWVGMEFHQIPLPSERDVDDDEDEEVVEYHDEGINNTMEGFGKQRRRARSFQVEVGTGFNQNILATDGSDDKLQQKERSTSGDGISTRFSPRIAADLNFEGADHFDGSTLHRSQSFGEASVSTADSSFSWISRGTSFLLKESDYPKTSNSSDPLLVHEGDFSTWGGANYNSLSSIAQSADNNFIPMGTQDLSAHVIPDFDRDLEMQDEQTKSKGKFSVFSKTKNASNSSNFSVEPSKSQGELEKKYPTFRCPKCNTLQREFLTVSSARTRFESPSQYIAIYFFIYMLMSLFIFGMEEGWPALDCVYFSVITLTTTGLGDYVPDNDAAKIICSIFIYFGVSCIGLLLGSMHASSLDDAAKKQAKENRTSNCVVCGRKQGHLATHALTHGLGKQASMQNSMQNFKKTNNMKSTTSVNETTSLLSLERTTYPPSSSSWYNPRGSLSKLNTIDETQHHTNVGWKASISTDTSSSQGSAGPAENTARQSNSRQNSAESPAAMTNIFDPAYKSSNRRRIETDATVNASNQNYSKTQPSTSSYTTTGTSANFHLFDDNISDIDNTDNNSQCSGWSTFSHPAEADNDILRPVSKIKAAKYVFLTLKQAFTNSLFVILIGSVGFYFIEEHMTVVDAFYFTTVLLTTVGYGDIVPKSPEGKLFCTVYSLIAGAVLLHQMSMISMIPLELRKRRIERSVLLQFGEDLDDTALEELTTGPLMRRLQLSGNNPEGLGQCTRETFALAMLVRLGRITEQDIRSTYVAFHKLDKNNDGFLTNSSKDVTLSSFDRKRRVPKSAMQDLGVFLPNQQLNTFRQQLPQDDVASESGRERGMSIESNFSAITYEDVDDANSRWSKNVP